jgi:hypothetical protein
MRRQLRHSELEVCRHDGHLELSLEAGKHHESIQANSAK